MWLSQRYCQSTAFCGFGRLPNYILSLAGLNFGPRTLSTCRSMPAWPWSLVLQVCKLCSWYSVPCPHYQVELSFVNGLWQISNLRSWHSDRNEIQKLHNEKEKVAKAGSCFPQNNLQAQASLMLGGIRWTKDDYCEWSMKNKRTVPTENVLSQSFVCFLKCSRFFSISLEINWVE